MIKKSSYYGLRAENYFLSLMNKLGLKTCFDDIWYDFKVNDQKVEVKSCSIFVKGSKTIKGKRKGYFRTGKFHFTNKENVLRQFKENVWICFIIRHEDEFMLMGFIKAKYLQKKPSISISKLGCLKLLNLSNWIEEINKEIEK